MISNPSTFSALTPLRYLRANQESAATSLQRLASGQRINSASDDPAGLITSENLRSVLAALDAESRSLERTNYVAATADAALSGISDQLIEAEALAVANANSAGLSDAEREANQMQIDSIVSSINRTVSSASFNGQALLDGSMTLTAGSESLSIESVALATPIGEGTEALSALQNARAQVNTLRGEIGSFSRNTIATQLSSNAVATENVATAESTIRDTDYAAEVAERVRSSLLSSTALWAVSMSSEPSASILSLLA